MMKQMIFFGFTICLLFSSIASAQNSDEEIANFEALHVLGFGRVHDAALSPDNSMIAIATEQGVRVYSFPEFETIQIFHRGYSYHVIWAQNGKFLIGTGGNIYFWRLNEDRTFTEVKRLTTYYFETLSLSPDEQYLVNTSGWRNGGNDMQIWRLEWSENSVERKFLFQSTLIPWGDTRPAYVANSPHWDAILGITWSPDSSQFVTVSYNRFIYWTIENNQVRWENWFPEWGYEESNVLWSPDGKFIWHSDYNQSLGISGLGVVSIASRGQGHKQGFPYIGPLAWLQEGRQLLATYDTRSAVQVWDVATREMIQEIVFPFDTTLVKLSTDQRYLVTSSYEYSIAVYELETGDLVATMPNHQRGPWGLQAVWLSENQILSMMGDRYEPFKVYLWDVEEERILDYVAIDPIEDIQYAGTALSSDHRFLAVAFEESPMRIYEIIIEDDDLRLVARHVTDGIYDNPQWSPDGKLLVARLSNSDVNIWNFNEPDGLSLCHALTIESLYGGWRYEFSPDSQQLALGGYSGLRIYKLPECGSDFDSSLLWEIENKEYLPDLAWSPDGQTLAYSYSSALDDDTQDPQVRLLDAHTGELIGAAEYWDAYGSPNVLRWSLDSQYLLLGYVGAKVEVVNAQDISVVLTILRGHAFSMGHSGGGYGSIQSLEWSPNGKRLLSFATDATIQIWGVAE